MYVGISISTLITTYLNQYLQINNIIIYKQLIWHKKQLIIRRNYKNFRYKNTFVELFPLQLSRQITLYKQAVYFILA